MVPQWELDQKLDKPCNSAFGGELYSSLTTTNRILTRHRFIRIPSWTDFFGTPACWPMERAGIRLPIQPSTGVIGRSLHVSTGLVITTFFTLLEVMLYTGSKVRR